MYNQKFPTTHCQHDHLWLEEVCFLNVALRVSFFVSYHLRMMVVKPAKLPAPLHTIGNAFDILFNILLRLYKLFI